MRTTNTTARWATTVSLCVILGTLFSTPEASAGSWIGAKARGLVARWRGGDAKRGQAQKNSDIAKAVTQLRQADQRTNMGFAVGMTPEFVRFTQLFDKLWSSDAKFRSRWAPRKGRLRQLVSGRYLDRQLKRIAKEAGIEIAMQVSEHGGGLNFIGATRYKAHKGGRSLKLQGVFSPGSYGDAKQCVGTRSASYAKGRGTYAIGELIISPQGELLMLERDVTGGARHLWAYYMDKLTNRKKPEAEHATSPDIMDARMYRDSATGKWVHRTGEVRVNHAAPWTGNTRAWRETAPWKGGDPSSKVIVVPQAGPRAASE